MKFVSTALSSLGIEFRACLGTMTKRNQAIEEFKTGNVPILILSSEDSVSGLNLTEASHVVIFHPFLVDGNGKHTDGDEFDADTKMALSFEKQGIARAWRSGQEKQVEVVRFLTKDSIEEELAKQRGYREGLVDNLDEEAAVRE
jgi:SNF2 family DNA or RNA helicase